MFIVAYNIALFVVMLVILCVVLPRTMDKVAKERRQEIEEIRKKYNF